MKLSYNYFLNYLSGIRTNLTDGAEFEREVHMSNVKNLALESIKPQLFKKEAAHLQIK